jgi:hypothetical protein
VARYAFVSGSGTCCDDGILYSAMFLTSCVSIIISGTGWIWNRRPVFTV